MINIYIGNVYDIVTRAHDGVCLRERAEIHLCGVLRSRLIAQSGFV